MLPFVLLLPICLSYVQKEELVYNETTQHAFTGETVHLKCSGVKQLQHATWFKKMPNNQEVQYSEGLTIASSLNETLKQRLNVSYQKNTSILILTIFNTSLNDCGKYRCFYDQIIALFDAITLVINDPPSVKVHYRNHTIYCNVSENDNTINKIVYKWEHRTIYNEHIRYFNNSNIGVLSIASDNRTAELLYLYNGKYTCTTEITIRNFQRSWIQTVETLVEIQGPPVCVKDGPTQNVIFSQQNVVVSLKFFSLPKYLDIVWSIDCVNTVIDQQKNYATVHEHNASVVAFDVKVKINVYVAKLIIYNVSKNDFGNYIARIINEVGQCECVTKVNDQDYINVVGSKEDDDIVSVEIKPDDAFSYKNIISHGIVVIVMIMLFCIILLCKFYIQRQCQHAKLNTNAQSINEPASEFDMQQIQNSYNSINEENMIEFGSPLQFPPAPFISVYPLEESRNDNGTNEHHNVGHEEIILQERTDNEETSSDDSVTHDTNDYLNPYQTLQISMLDIHNYSDIIYPVAEVN